MDQMRRLTPEERTIPFQRWWNVRDLGGLPTESGGITRSDVVVRATTPEHATPADVEKARRRGLTTFVDLRTPRDPAWWFSESPEVHRRVVNVVASVHGVRETDDEVLTVILDQGRREVGEAIRAVVELAESSPPVVLHCHTGKDRTGLVVMILLLLSGVPREVVVEDYLASNPGFEQMRAVLDPSGDTLFSPKAPAAVRGPVTLTAADAALRFIDESGGVRAYLRSAGLSDEEIDRAAGLLFDGD